MNNTHLGSNPYAKLWMALQAMSVTLFAIKGYEYAWVSLQSDGTRIMGVLFGIFLIFQIKNCYDFWILSRENKDLIVLVSLSWEKKDGRDHLISKEELSRGRISEAIALLNLRLKRQLPQDIDLEDLLSHWHWEIEKRSELMKHGANVLVTLGLIGTVAGLIITIGGLEGVMLSVDSGEGTEGLLGGISQTLGGMSTAFYTTLFGAILGGAFLKTSGLFVYNASVHGLMQCSKILESRLLEKAQPRLEKSPQDSSHYSSDLEKRLDRLIDVLEKK